MKREECLKLAINTVCKTKEDEYGNPENNFDTIAEFWSTYLSRACNQEIVISSEDVANMMILLKISRSVNGNFKEDNYIDIAGYASCACEMYDFPNDGL